MKKLLIVDDDEALRGLICRRLSTTYTVFETGEAEQALALALEHKPDAILLDLRMPKFDGFELCRNFRSLSYTSNLPIFVITGESGGHKKECETIGATGYFEKPIVGWSHKQRYIPPAPFDIAIQDSTHTSENAESLPSLTMAGE